MRKKIYIFLAGIFTLFIIVNLSLILWLTASLRQTLIHLQATQFTESSSSVKKAESAFKLITYTSLGTVKLLSDQPIYVALDQFFALHRDLLTISTQLEPLTQSLLDPSSPPLVLPDAQQLKPSIDSIGIHYHQFASALESNQIRSLSKLFGFTPQLEKFRQHQHLADTALNTFSAILPHLDQLLGYNSPQNYLILFQNNYELRPTGGFLGSYAYLTISQARITKFHVEDIYTPDGQLPGYVDEPYPLHQFLHDGVTHSWRLRDSNWNPDFPKSVETINWFFDHGGVKSVDAYFAINLYPVLDLVNLLEPLTLPDYNTPITTDNFYHFTQSQVQSDFFPGSTQKRSFLSALGTHLWLKLQSLSSSRIASIAPIILDNLYQKQILLSHTDPSIQAAFNQAGVSGQLTPLACSSPNCQADYLHINEANLGVNKANCCINRQFDLRLGQETDKLIHHLSLTFDNQNPLNAKPPESWGGRYDNYLRLYLPQDTDLESLILDQQILDSSDYLTSTYLDKLVIEVYLEVLPQTSKTLQVIYNLPLDPQTQNLDFLWQKQSGIPSVPISITSTPNLNSPTPNHLTGDLKLQFSLPQN